MSIHWNTLPSIQAVLCPSKIDQHHKGTQDQLLRLKRGCFFHCIFFLINYSENSNSNFLLGNYSCCYFWLPVLLFGIVVFLPLNHKNVHVAF